MIYLDTHTLIWLVVGELGRLSQQAQALLKKEDLLISPMVKLELEFLHEIKRIKFGSERFLEVAHKEAGVTVCSSAFEEVIAAACAEHWTRDPFDRIIVAQARVNRARLLSLDRGIQSNYQRAFS